MSAQAAVPDPIGDRVRNEIDKAFRRNIRGLEYLAQPAPAMGLTPKDVVLKNGTLNLCHYRPMAEEVYRVPVLMVMATTNKASIFDLAPGQSLIEFLLKAGFDVYVIDWSPPAPAEKRLRIEDYVLRFIPDCIHHVQGETGETDISIIGYCMGGILSLIYAGLHPDGPLTNLACFTTPIDFEQMGLFRAWTDRRHFDVDSLVDTLGNIPPELVSGAFEMLRPAAKIAGMVQLWDNLWNDDYVKSYRMFDRWATDQLPLAGEYFRQTVKELMWENRLYKNELMIGGRHADLRAIKVPLLHIVAEHDHIAPYDATKALMGLVDMADKQEIMLKGGHVSVIAGVNAAKRMWPKLDEWLGERSI